MAIYSIQNQWGTMSSPWHYGGVFVLGNQSGKYLSYIDINSTDNGKTYSGTIAFAGEGKTALKATQEEGVDGNNYSTQVQNGSGKWKDSGKWLIGGRGRQRAIYIRASSEPNGNLNGIMAYAGEGGINMKGKLIPGTAYTVQSPWAGMSENLGGSGQSGFSLEGSDGAILGIGFGGVMVLGTKKDEAPVDLDLTSKDGGKTLEGTITYEGGKPIDFSGTYNDLVLNAYSATYSPGSSDEQTGGQMVIGAYTDMKVTMLKVKSEDNGQTLKGDIGYSGGGMAGFVGTNQTSPSS